MKRVKFIPWLAVAVCAVVAGTLVPGLASSHRESPLGSADPQIDATDLYAFVSPDAPDTVTLISNWIPFQNPAGGPNFFPWGENVKYDINVDNNGDARPDITYRWTFRSSYKSSDTFLYNTGPVNDLKDPTLNFTQTYTLERIAGGRTHTLLTDAPVAPSYVGAASMPDYRKLRDQAIVSLPGTGGKSFVGQADDPFFLDLRVFDLLYGGNLQEVGADTLDGFNVNVMAIQVPKPDLVQDGDAAKNPIIGVWTTASRPSTSVINAQGAKSYSGPDVQVARLGNPLVNEVVVPVGSKDLFNASKPEGDAAFLPKVQDPEVPKLIEKIYNIKAPTVPRDDLVAVFLTGVDGLTKPAAITPSEQLRLNTSIAPSPSPNRLGVLGNDKAGFPNGRRLTDDVVDIELRALEGAVRGTPVDLGDGVDANDVAFTSSFPYLAMPHSGSAARVSTPDGDASGAARGAAAGTSGGDTDDSDFPVWPLVAVGGGVVLAAVGFVLGRRARATS
jgi:hypothetical protein